MNCVHFGTSPLNSERLSRRDTSVSCWDTSSYTKRLLRHLFVYISLFERPRTRLVRTILVRGLSKRTILVRGLSNKEMYKRGVSRFSLYTKKVSQYKSYTVYSHTSLYTKRLRCNCTFDELNISLNISPLWRETLSNRFNSARESLWQCESVSLNSREMSA